MENDLTRKFIASSSAASNEEDVRIAANIFLDGLGELFNINKKASSEVTSIRGGRADSIYSDIIFEFKTPSKFNSQKGIDEALYGRDTKDRGLFHYLVNFTLDDGKIHDDEHFKYILFSKVGVAFDGKKFIFCRFVDDAQTTNLHDTYKTKNFPAHISSDQSVRLEIETIDDFKHGIKKLILLARSTDRKILSANNLLESFSSTSALSTDTINYLYTLLNEDLRTNSQIKTLFDEWNRIFGDIYGKEETDFTQYKDDLAKMYSLEKDMDIRKCLFILQTFYSIVIKLLIHNLLESLTDPTKKARKPHTQKELTSLFLGNHYTDYRIDNFFEIDFFQWFIMSENFNIEYIQNIINELDTYETTASVIKPEVVQDVLKRVYQSLIPKGLRHLMGEYYTPDWLVDFTIEKSGITFSPNESVLDPTCGSGTFLTHLIKGVINKNKEQYSAVDLTEKIVKNIVGFDINPIAVISSKANYILSLGDITELKTNITIPIYMCDSILVPTVHAKQIENTHSIKIGTVVGEFIIPVFASREENDYFLRTASSCIMQDYTFDEFSTLLENEKVIILANEQFVFAQNFYDKLSTLHTTGKNGFWPILLKNSFAPLFSHDKFDVIIGNPPWITWKAMSDTYRKMTLDIWLSYGIFEKNAYDKITSHDDFAMAVTYVSIDHYLKEHGKVGFVLPQTFVKSLKGGEGFRKFTITRDGLEVPFAVNEVYDMLKISPFKGEASNRTSVYVFEKNRQMKYPMHRYYEARNLDTKNPVQYSDTYEVASSKIAFDTLSAKPINQDLKSPWLTVDESLIHSIDKFLGASPYKARKGIEPAGAKGVYLVNVLAEKNGDVEIENLIERSRLQKAKDLGIHRGLVEKTFVYPMVGGRNFDKWGLNSSLHMLVPHFSNGESIYRGVNETELKTKYRKTYEWLYYFKDLLLETRIRSAKFFVKDVFPFYRLDNVGEYTFSKYKVLWKEQSKEMTAAVVSELDDKYLGRKTVVTDSKVLYVSLDNENEAHYLCAVLNSRLLGKIIEAYTIDVQKGVDIVKNLNIPKFNSANSTHAVLANLSQNAHNYYLENKKGEIDRIQSQIEIEVEKIFQ